MEGGGGGGVEEGGVVEEGFAGVEGRGEVLFVLGVGVAAGRGISVYIMCVGGWDWRGDYGLRSRETSKYRRKKRKKTQVVTTMALIVR